MAEADHIDARRRAIRALDRLYAEPRNKQFHIIRITEREKLSKLGQKYFDAAVEALGENRPPVKPIVEVGPLLTKDQLVQINKLLANA